MPTIRCPECKSTTVLVGRQEYDGTVQCESCTLILRVKIEGGVVANVALRKLDLDIPRRLPAELKRILSDAVRCFEIDVHSAALILARAFTESLLREAGMKSEGIKTKIEAAHKSGIISDFSYHAASASRLMGNLSAHAAAELANLKSSECRRALELVRDLAEEVVAARKLGSKQK